MSTEHRTDSLALARYRRLPRRSSSVWQGGVVRLPAWIESPGGAPPWRPWAAVWVAGPDGLVHMNTADSGMQPDAAFAADVIVELALKHQDKLAGRPGCIEVLDAAFGRAIVEYLGDPEVRVDVVPAIEAVQHVMVSFAERDEDGPDVPALQDDPEITVEDVRQFAVAARRFWQAEPWQYLTDEDLILIDAPRPDPHARCVVVMGNAGLGYGLAFYASPADYDEMAASPTDYFRDRPHWSVTFDTPDLMPFADHDLWEAHDLPLADPSRYPIAMAFGPGDTVTRPSRSLLRQFETILVALAESTETDMDSGRWRTVVTGSGTSVPVDLSLPNVLDPDHADRQSARPAHQVVGRRASSADTPLERAQEIADEAFDAIGRQRVILAREALTVSPDCADAYIVLAEHAASPARALPFYEQGVAAGQRALGADPLVAPPDHAWATDAAEPYVRARVGLAQTLVELDRVGDAIRHYQDLLRLVPRDDEGVRYLLLLRYVVAGRNADAVDLLDQYPDDPAAEWMYTRALVSYRTGMASQAAAELAAARRVHHTVAHHLLDPDATSPEAMPAALLFGEVEEAAEYADVYGDIWRATPGAMEWLRQAERSGKKPRHGKSGGHLPGRQRLH